MPMTRNWTSDDSIKSLKDMNDLTDEQIEDFVKFKNEVTTVKCQIEPFSYIANIVATDFRNFLKAVTLSGANRAGISQLYGKKYYEDDEIENEKDPVKRQNMIDTNNLWKEARIKINNAFSSQSLNAPINSKDDNERSLLDSIASPENIQDYVENRIMLQDDITAMATRIQIQYKTAMETPEDNFWFQALKFRGFLSVMYLAKFVYTSIDKPTLTVRNVLSYVGGKTKVGRKAAWLPQHMTHIARNDADGSSKNPFVYGLLSGRGHDEDFRSVDKTPFELLRSIRSNQGLYFIYKDNNTVSMNNGGEKFKNGLEFTNVKLLAPLKKVYENCYNQIIRLGDKLDINIEAYNDYLVNPDPAKKDAFDKAVLNLRIVLGEFTSEKIHQDYGIDSPNLGGCLSKVFIPGETMFIRNIEAANLNHTVSKETYDIPEWYTTRRVILVDKKLMSDIITELNNKGKYESLKKLFKEFDIDLDI